METPLEEALDKLVEVLDRLTSCPMCGKLPVQTEGPLIHGRCVECNIKVHGRS